ncbi:MAG: inositol monophosphatase [Candidatus Marinimicrobia bacterium]|nr:inositol monophosphatase [Candidatus Neomarinimicrobiota bacterium]|tara:strand:- start:2653 stop:3441 length:789 start_codon:yes stop_codon:yes gene_type:complete
MIESDQLLGVALEAAEQAASLISDEAEKILKVDLKGATNLVTQVDVAAEEIIIETIRSHFPDHQFLAEETGKTITKSDYLWIIDPIDGTTNFVHGYPFYAVSVAIRKNGETVAGVVNHVSIEDVYAATKGNGAQCNGKQISVSSTRVLKQSLLATGFAYEHDDVWARNMDHFRKFTDITQGVRRAGSASLDFCHVARGWLDGFWEFGLSPWDTAAGALIVTESGGNTSLTNGDPFDLFSGEVVASNDHLHEEMLEILQRETA